VNKCSNSGHRRLGAIAQFTRSDRDEKPGELWGAGEDFVCRCGFELLHQATSDLMSIVPAHLENHSSAKIRLAEALVRNQAIWNAMVLDVAGGRNRFPDGIKNLLVNLYIYVNANSKQLLAEDEHGDLEMLILINRNVIDGLHCMSTGGG
jgi:flagellar biosynthesis regulator FlaF